MSLSQGLRYGGYHILSADPLIVAAYGIYYNGQAVAEHFMPPRPGWFKPALLLEFVSWYQSPGLMEIHADRQRRFSANGSLHVLVVNTDEEIEMADRFGVRCVLGNHNLLVDERVMKPDTSVEKCFDAIYIARLHHCKRLPLAAELDTMLVLPAREGLHEHYPMLRHATSIARRLNTHEVASHIQQARVGLCLSEEEGAMLASAEYLLCGIPIVTTPSRGGRECLMSADTTLKVHPDAGEVRAAVEEWKRRDPDPEYVRRSTLSRMRPLRERFMAVLAALFSETGCDRSAEEIGERMLDIQRRSQCFLITDHGATDALDENGGRTMLQNLAALG